MAVTDAPARWTVLGPGVWALLDDVVEPFVVLDSDGRIVECNQSADAAFGWTRERHGYPEAMEMLIAPDQRAEFRDAFHDCAASADAQVRRAPIELRVVHRSGHEIPVDLVLSEIAGADRRLFAAVLRDVSERKQAQARQKRLEMVVDSSGEAILSGSLDGRIESWNPAAERLFGYSATEMIGTSATRLLPTGTFAGFGPAMHALANGEPASLELPARHKDGRLVEVAVTLSPLCPDGEITGVASIARDVTERNRTTARLALANSRFAGAFQAASIGMALVGLDGSFLEVNQALCRLLARDTDALVGTSFQELTHPDDLASSLEHLQLALSGKIDTFQQTKRYLLPDGGIMWALLTLTIVPDGDGAPLHFVAQIQDITAQKTAEGELRRYATQLEALSEQDPLTGLSNRHAFTTALAAELCVLEVGGSPCSVVLARIPGGDAEVAAAAESLQSARRDTDLVAHLGKGELAVLLPGIGPRTAVAIAQRARDALASHVGARLSHATAVDGDSVDTLMARAGEKLGSPRPVSAIDAADQTPTGIGRLLEIARRQLEMPIAFLTRLDDGHDVFARLSGEYESLGLTEGDPVPLDVTTALGLRAYARVPVRLRSTETYGTLCVGDTKPHPELAERQTELLRFLSELAADLIQDAAVQRETRRAEAGATGVRTLLAALEARDFYTGEHSKRVVALASAVARSLGLDDGAARDVEQVALLHDIGKVGIPDAILQKQGPLDDQEWELMRQHPIVGERIIAGTPGLSHLAPAVRAEHERWNGSGYPDGLAGEQIPLASRITLACDALHAMTSDRPYRSALTLQAAREELRACAGSQFDPRVIAALLAEIDTPAEAEPRHLRTSGP